MPTKTTTLAWLESYDPFELLGALQSTALPYRPGGGGPDSYYPVSDRKFRLFACACFELLMRCENPARVPSDQPQLRQAVARAYALAEGLPCSNVQSSYWVDAMPARNAAAQAVHTTRHHVVYGGKPIQGYDRPAVANLLREVLGDPTAPVVLEPAWLAWNDGCVGKAAAGIYARRSFEELPVLADALEDAGCDHALLLDHLRGYEPYAECPTCKDKPGMPTLCATCLLNRKEGRMRLRAPHVLGDWALDLCLGKS